MLQDVMEGIASIDSAMEPMEEKLIENDINNRVLVLKERISKAVVNYEGGQKTNLEIQVTNEILLAFTDWKKEIEKILKPYVLS